MGAESALILHRVQEEQPRGEELQERDVLLHAGVVRGLLVTPRRIWAGKEFAGVGEYRSGHGRDPVEQQQRSQQSWLIVV